MDFRRLKGKTIFISGFGKNCGKTAFLNLLLSRISGRRAYFSVGVDGEKNDGLSGAIKPRIKSLKGDIFIYSPDIASTPAGVKIINSYENGRIFAAETLRGGFVEISGPSGNHKISGIVSDLREAGAETVIVDGAFDRLTQVSSVPSSQIFYVCRVSPENLNETADRISLLFSLAASPCIKENMPFFSYPDREPQLKGGNLFFPGAFTNEKAASLPREADKIFLEDITKVFLDYKRWKELKKEKKIYFAARIELTAFVVNLYNIHREVFEQKLEEKKVLEKVIYNPYEYFPLRRT